MLNHEDSQRNDAGGMNMMEYASLTATWRCYITPKLPISRFPLHETETHCFLKNLLKPLLF